MPKNMDKTNTSKPNIVWFMIDSFRPKLLSPLDKKRELTFVDELVEKGAFFEQCITAAPYTIASMHAMLTGFYPSVNKLDGWFQNTPDDMDKKTITFTDVLKSEGYSTFAFFPKRSRPYLPPYSFDHFQLVGSPDEFSFSAYLSAPSPKLAIFYLEEVHDTCCRNAGKYDKEKYYRSAKESAERVRYFYEKCCKEDDIIAVTSDHGIRVIGEPCAPHHKDEMVSGKYLTDKTIKTFFALIAKGKIATGKKVEELVRTIDIAPTLLEVAGLPVIKAQGIPLLPYLEGERKMPEFPAFSITGGMETSPWKPDTWSIRTPEWKFVLTKTKKPFFRTVYKEELYNLKQDMAETKNVIEDFPEVVRSLSGKLKEFMGNSKKVEDYYKEKGFDYKKYLKVRIYPFKLRLELWFRTFVAFKMFLRPKTQLAVLRSKLKKSSKIGINRIKL